MQLANDAFREGARKRSLFLKPVKLNMKMKKSTVKAVLKPTVQNVQTPNSAAVTTIDVKMDVGFGNAIFLRGQGSGLTWDRGIPLVCVDGKTWRWSQAVTDPITFKILINDKVWSAGKDLTVAPGQKLEVAPSFA
jgi:hypothetical protein